MAQNVTQYCHVRKSQTTSGPPVLWLVKIENRSRKRSHKLDENGVGRIRTFPFSCDSAYDSVAYDPVKTGKQKQKRKKQSQCCLRLRQSSLKRHRRRIHKRNRYSASDSVGLILTRSYRITLRLWLLSLRLRPPSLVKTSEADIFLFSLWAPKKDLSPQSDKRS